MVGSHAVGSLLPGRLPGESLTGPGDSLSVLLRWGALIALKESSMKASRALVLGLVLASFGLSISRTLAYVEERYTLPRVINESTNIVVLQVEKVNKERKLIFYKKIADLKGNHPTEVIK